MRSLALAGLLALAACGDDQRHAKPTGWQWVDLETAYDEPADFDRSECTPGRFASLDPDGVWGLIYAYGPHYAYDGSLVIRNDGVDFGFEDGGMTIFDEDDLFGRVVREDGSVYAFDFCSSDGTGRLVGRYAECSSRGCFEDRLTAGRLARIPGEPEAYGLELVGEIAASAKPLNVRVRDGMAYLATDAGLEIIDVSDPERPVARGVFPEPWDIGYNDVKVFEVADGRFFVLASGYGPTTVLDVSDPDAPESIASFESAHTVFTETWNGHTRAYLGSRDLVVYDLDDPADPRHLGTYFLPEADVFGGNVHDLFVEHGRAYLGYWDRGLTIVDTWPDPAAATLVGRFMGYPYRTSHSVWVTTIDGCKVAAHGDEGPYAHLRLIGVDEACPDTFLRQLGEIETRPEVSIHNVMAFGTRAYASYYQDGIRLYDIADPTSPRPLAHVNTYTWPTDRAPFYFDGAIGIDVDLEQRLIYVADSVRGLLILRETF